MNSRRIALLLTASLLVAACMKPGAELAAAPGCGTRIIVRFAADEVPLAELERVAGARLAPVARMTPGLHVLDVEAAGAAEECDEAVARLRRDARIASVDVDTRRQPHSQ